MKMQLFLKEVIQEEIKEGEEVRRERDQEKQEVTIECDL